MTDTQAINREIFQQLTETDAALKELGAVLYAWRCAYSVDNPDIASGNREALDRAGYYEGVVNDTYHKLSAAFDRLQHLHTTVRMVERESA